MMAKVLFWAFQKIRWIRKKALGGAFLEGTWVGCIFEDETYFLTVEHFFQESGRLIIKGWQWDPAGNLYSTWESHCAEIDIKEKKGTLRYAYTCTVNGEDSDGICNFKIKGGSKKDVLWIEGYAADNHRNKNEYHINKNEEKRVSLDMLDEDEAMKMAAEAFKGKIAKFMEKGEEPA